ncbi:MAG: iron-containing alcohol dehydrogenase [Pseudomonadota bacterium]
MSLTATWSYPTTVRFGAGRLTELAEACRVAAIARPLLITDRGLARLPITERALGVLEGAGLGRALFTEVDPNPNETNLAAGIAAYRAGGHDGVVAFGGGSALDLGKLVAFMAGQTRPVWDFEDVGDWWTRADASAIAPIVAVPTTAGTGSEVGRAGVLTNTATHEKKIIFHPKLLPAQVICDPELTLGMPQAITAGTGMDAFAHCVEAYCAPGFHPMSHGIALEGMRLVATYLPRAYADGTDLEARAQMMAAAMMGAVAFQKGLGAVHALSHPIGARYDVHHGTLNAVLLPHVLRANREAVAEPLARAVAYLGIEGGFDAFIGLTERLNRTLAMPEGLVAMGVRANDASTIAEMALSDPSAGGNPLPMSEPYARALFEAAR